MSITTRPTMTLRNLSVLNYANGFTLWHYKSSGDGRECMDAEFWTDARDLIAPGDIVYASGPDGAVQMQFDQQYRPRPMSASA